MQLFNQLVRQLVQKFLSAKLIKTKEIARIYHENASPEVKEAVIKYTQYGIAITPSIFDTTLRCALLALTPIYRKFFYSAKGLLLRQHYMGADEEAAQINATMLQTMFRMRLAARVKNKLLEIAERKRKEAEEKALEEARERQRLLDKFNSAGGDGGRGGGTKFPPLQGSRNNAAASAIAGKPLGISK